MMTKDKAGVPVFEAGKDYRMKVFINPVWPMGSVSHCEEVKDEGRQGFFRNGDDSRWWYASEQFEVSK